MARTATSLDNSSNTNSTRFYPCRKGRDHTGSSPPELLSYDTGNSFLEADSQEFKAGDMVYLNAGAVTQRLLGDNGPIAGFALTDATNVSSGNAQIRIDPVNTRDEYIMNVYSSTAADTDRGSVALLVGATYNLIQMTVTEQDSSTTYCTAVDLDTQTDQRVLITGIYPDPELTSSHQYIRVFVKFLSYGMVSGAPTYQGLQYDI